MTSPPTEETSAALREALAPVLADLAATGVPRPAVRDEDVDAQAGVVTAMLWREDGTGSGVLLVLDEPVPLRVASVAEHVQDWAMDTIWSAWPLCPRHPDSHPLQPDVEGGEAVWRCPRDGSRVWAVGGIADEGRPR